MGDLPASSEDDAADFVYVDEGWWHPNVKSGQVHDHGPNITRSMHRLCEPVYTRRPVGGAGGT